METVAHIAPYQALKAENEDLRHRVVELKYELSQLKGLLFGAKSERFVPVSTPGQLPLFDQALPSEPVTETVPILGRRTRRKKPARQVLPLMDPSADASAT